MLKWLREGDGKEVMGSLEGERNDCPRMFSESRGCPGSCRCVLSGKASQKRDAISHQKRLGSLEKARQAGDVLTQ